MTTMIEKVARAIALANGDQFSNAFKDKSRWNAKRGMSGGRFRDINEPFQMDYLDMARAAIEAMREPAPKMTIVLRGADMDHAEAWGAMIDAALSEADA